MKALDGRIQELIDYTYIKLGLENYILQRHKLYRKVNFQNETIYTLSMEWFPKNVTELDEDLNPVGTAVVELRIDNRKFESIIFVDGKSYADSLTFSNVGLGQVVNWIEQETGLKNGAQFRLVEEKTGEYRFQECYHGVPVSPSGYIEIKFDDEGRLIFYSVFGSFPSAQLFNMEEFTLSLNDVEEIAAEQVKRIDFPSYEKKQLIPIYALEEIYIRNDLGKTIPFEVFPIEQAFVKIEKPLYWETKSNQPFERMEIKFHEDISSEQAFSLEPHPDLEPISPHDQEQAIAEVIHFLQRVYPEDSGKWILKTLHREKCYIHATLRRQQTDHKVFQRKLIVFLDQAFKAVNYIDNEMMLEMLHDFTSAGEVKIQNEEAFAKLKPFLTLKPVYVYDTEEERFVLCGKLDCHDGVHAVSGEVVSLDEI